MCRRWSPAGPRRPGKKYSRCCATRIYPLGIASSSEVKFSLPLRPSHSTLLCIAYVSTLVFPPPFSSTLRLSSSYRSAAALYLYLLLAPRAAPIPRTRMMPILSNRNAPRGRDKCGYLALFRKSVACASPVGGIYRRDILRRFVCVRAFPSLSICTCTSGYHHRCESYAVTLLLI